MINPAKEVALKRSPTSMNILVVLGINTWKKTKKSNDVKIVNKIFDISSVKVLFSKLKLFKNSIGKNKINRDAKKSISPQNKLSPDQEVKFWEE